MTNAPPNRSLVRVGAMALLMVVLVVGLAGAVPLGPDGSPTAIASQDRQANEPPVAAFEFSPQQPEPGETIVLNATASHDPDGEIVTYRWDFDGDGQVDAEGGPNRRLAFPRAGEFTVRLTVVDNDSATNTTTRVIQVVGDQPPEARLSVSPSAVTVGETITLDPTASSDPDGQIETWELDTDGDGTFDETFDSPTTLRTGYEEPGTYQATLRVTDNDGLTDTATVSVEVEALATTAGGGATSSPDGGTEGPTAGPGESEPPGGGSLLPGGGLAIAAGIGVLVLLALGAVLYSRASGPETDAGRPLSGSDGAEPAIGPVASVALAALLVLVLVGVPAFLVNRRFVGPADGPTAMTVALVEVVALAMPALLLAMLLVLQFVGQREDRTTAAVGPFDPDGLRWLTYAFGFVASVLLTVALAALLLAGSLPLHLTLAAGLLLGAVSVVPLLLAVVLVSLSVG